MATVEEVLALVQQLTPEEQDELIDRLFVEEESIDPAYMREIERRARSVAEGQDDLIPWEQVRDETMNRLGIGVLPKA